MNASSRELIVDSFAGAGGASLGIEMALGRSPDVAINHDAEALSMHAANHPATLHLPHNVWKIDPIAVCGGRPVGLLWASPDCKHFSKAKGGKPVARNIRDLAWVVVRWARQVRPRVILLENVEEFRTWGPLGEDGRPCPVRKGETFKRWVGELKRLGYAVEHRELRACDYGAPTIRKRLFLVARCDGRPIVWPKPTHGDPKSDAVRSGKLAPWRTAAGIIDWSLPCPSIFLTREEGRAIGVKRPLAEATMARIAKGVKRYALDAAEPFVVSVAHGESRSRREYPIGEPLGTITGQGRSHGLVAPIVSYGQHGGANRDAGDPLHTVTASLKDTNAVVAAHLTKFHAGQVGGDLADPAPTVTANGFVKRPGGAPPIGVVAAHLMTMRNSGKPFNGADQPTHTVTSGGAHLHLVSAFLAQHNTDMVGHKATEPVSTIVQKGCTQAVVSAGLVNLKGSDRRGSAPDAPHPTVTAQGCHSADVRAFLVKYYGEGGTDQAAGDPLHTIPTKARFGLVTIAGETYEIADIGMRMLTPRELFRAQGFPDSYVIDHGVPIGSAGVPARDAAKPLTLSAQIRMCGNSVSPPVAAALVAANYAADQLAPARRASAVDDGPLFKEAV